MPSEAEAFLASLDTGSGGRQSYLGDLCAGGRTAL